MPWYAIRSVYLFGIKQDTSNIFEERIVSIEASSWDEAHAKGEKESNEYAVAHDMTCYPEQEGYKQDGENQIDGYEIWSQLFESKLSLEAFFAERYSRYNYKPD